MPNQKVADSLESLGRALERLREGLELSEAAPLAIDGTIQRFEFVIEYDETAARAIYSRIRTYWPEFKRCHAMLVDRFRGD